MHEVVRVLGSGLCPYHTTSLSLKRGHSVLENHTEKAGVESKTKGFLLQILGLFSFFS